MRNYHALALFSGGLDSILAAGTIRDQGLDVLGLHFVSPFFGHPERIARWREIYGLDIVAVDAGEEFTEMLLNGPPHGLGKRLNPCVDCKIFMLARAMGMLPQYGASFIVSGEVVGQRPMSQRRDALDVISRDSGAREVLLRPLCAQKLPETPMESSGLVDRERLHDFWGRGRTNQLTLAAKMGITEIPTPAGGCRLTEKESCKRYVPAIEHLGRPDANDFYLANEGRQFWAGSRWLSIGRNQGDNERIARLARKSDLVLKVEGFPGPLALGRQIPGEPWDNETVRQACALVASFSPKAARSGGEVQVAVGLGASPEEAPGEARLVTVIPCREPSLGWREPEWEEGRAWKKQALKNGVLAPTGAA